MHVYSSYKDLCVQIEIHKERLKSINDEIYYYKNTLIITPKGYSSINIDGEPKGKFVPIPLDKTIEILNKLYNQQETEKRLIERLVKSRNRIGKKLRQLKGLDFQVCYLRDIESMTLQGIADTLIFSLSYIEKISARNPKEIKRVQEE